MQDRSSLLRRMEEAKQAKQAALEEQRSAREMQELLQCTFKPSITHAPRPDAKVGCVHAIVCRLRECWIVQCSTAVQYTLWSLSWRPCACRMILDLTNGVTTS
jgi:hypothetical protein